MAKQRDLLDRIDEVRANSVTPEKFKEAWGYSLEDHVEDMMDFIRELEAKESPAKETFSDVEESARVLPAAVPAAAAKEGLKSRLAADAPEREALERLMKKVQALLKQMKESRNYGEIGQLVTIGDPKSGKRKGGTVSWELKLVAVDTGSGKTTLASGAPVIITSVDNPKEERIVAQVYNPGKKGRIGKAGLKPMFQEPKGMEAVTLKDSVRGLMVDVGDLVTVYPGVGAGAVKRSKGPKGAKG